MRKFKTVFLRNKDSRRLKKIKEDSRRNLMDLTVYNLRNNFY